ncbi:MAG: gliding motility protein GldN [Flavobacteriales bacterium]|nr:gliding motility protein GldN [Flavobacteriales bacterium]
MKYLIFSISLLFSCLVTGQNILNASSPAALRAMRDAGLKITATGDTVNAVKEPLPYGFIETKDILWAKTVWEIIDLNEKVNQPLYYTSNSLVQKTNSLYQVLMDAVMNGKVKEVYDDEDFMYRLNPDEIKNRVVSVKTDDSLIDLLNEGIEITDEVKSQYTDTIQTDTRKVKLIKIKGMWYVDKRLGELRYRLLGIAPQGPDPQAIGESFYDPNELIDLFWVWYPDVRKELANHSVFNPRNNMSSVSYDDVLNARRFSSVIYKSESGFGGGKLEEYLPRDAKAQMEESHRIREAILQVENDMWNY